jgi:hypothetical protein
MSLAINVDNVGKVLLADGWHDVDTQWRDGTEEGKATSSFCVDAYEFIHGSQIVGNLDSSAAGFSFVSPGSDATTFGPLSAILAVKYYDSVTIEADC